MRSSLVQGGRKGPQLVAQLAQAEAGGVWAMRSLQSSKG